MLNYSELHKILKEKYGNLGWWPSETRDQIIFGAILTQNTSWKNVEAALKNLKEKKIDTIPEITNVDQEDLKEMIRPAGFFNQKSVYLKEICTRIQELGGIEKIDQMKDSDIEDFLLKTKGIGIETMQDIMLYAFNRKVFVVDKYTERFFSRLGLIEPGMNNAYSMGVEIQRDMDLEDLKNFHGEIVEISKEICKSKPLCEICFLRQNCNYEKDLTEP